MNILHTNDMQKQHKTIVLSDIHLGSKWSKTREVTAFLRDNSCQTLILCGDIIDGWALQRGTKGKWQRRHTKFLKMLLDISLHTEIIYVRGNHDDFLDRVAPIHLLNFSIVKDYIYISGGKRFYVLHGDVFDKVTSSMSWLARVGDIGYSFLLWANKQYNHRRIKRGLPYYSIAKQIKNRVKASVSYISDFEKHVVDIARAKGCQGVICGHIHHPEIRMYGNIMYLNSGDWVESLSALTEDFDGNWAIYHYQADVADSVNDADADIADSDSSTSVKSTTQI